MSEMSYTPLHIACYQAFSEGGAINKAKLIDLINASTPDMWKIKDKSGFTPLHIGISYLQRNLDNVNLLSLLLTHGAESTWNIVDLKGYTPFHVACEEQKDPEVFKIMFAHGANSTWNIQDINGYTPLHVACVDQTDPEIFKILFAHGANSTWNIQNTEGFTPFHMACEYQNNHEVFKIMFAHGANSTWNIQSKDGYTPFHLACDKKDPEVFKIMFAHGANSTWNIQEMNGDTPFHMACKYQENHEVFKIMFAHGANSTWSIQDINGCTPFHVACEYQKDKEVFKIMLAHGANICLDITDKYNKRPIDYVKTKSIQALIIGPSPQLVSPVRSARMSSVKSVTKEHIDMVSLCNKKFTRLINVAKAKDYPPTFKRLVNILSKTCVKIYDTRECTNNALDIKVKRLHEKWVDDSDGDGKQITLTTYVKYELISLIDYIRRHQDVNILQYPLDSFNIKYVHSVAIDAGGPRNQFFQNAANQLFSMKLFMPTEDASNIYTFNTHLEFKDIEPFGLHLDLELDGSKSGSISNGSANTKITKMMKKLIARLYCIVGEFMTFLVVNRIKFDNHICRSILARLMYDNDHIYDEEYVLYHMMDYPTFGKTMLELIERPDMFDTQMTYAMYEHDDKPVTLANKNFRAFLIENAKTTLVAENMYMDALRKGFLKGHRRKALLASIKINLADFDTLLTGSKLSPATITALVDTVQHNSTQNVYDEKCRNVLNWFCTILRECVSNNNKINKANTLFMKKLFMFWTGVSSYNSWFKYSVTFHGGDSIRSSTCGKQLMLPKDIPSRAYLLEALHAVIDSDNFNVA